MSLAAPLAPHRHNTHRDLLQRMHAIGFGRMHDLCVRAGAPAFEPAPRIEYDIKLASGDAPSEFELSRVVRSKEAIALFAHMRRLGDGVIKKIEIRHGLPFSIVMEEVAPA